jgi:hypothetical protein
MTYFLRPFRATSSSRSRRQPAWAACFRPLLAACALALIALSAARAQGTTSPPPSPPPRAAEIADSVTPGSAGTDLTIHLLTIGQGSQVWELFGHNALWIHDASKGTDSVYHWGVFDFSEPNFIPRFLKGLMSYSIGETTLVAMVMDYRHANRQIWAQRLDLTPAQRVYIRDYIRWNQRPENRRYRYDYYLDNCSTRIRDLLDSALVGELRAQIGQRTTTGTFRSNSIRLMQRDALLALGVDIAAGSPTDRPLTEWEEAFLPMSLQRSARRVVFGENRTRLVASEDVLLEASRAPEPMELPARGVPLLLLGAIIAAAIVMLGIRPSLAARRTAALIAGVWSVLAGTLGTVLLLLWVATDHWATHRNENLLLLNPLWFAAVGIAIAMWRGGRGGKIGPRAAIVAVPALFAAALHLFGLSRQDNMAIAGLVLPIALALGVVQLRLLRERHAEWRSTGM